MQNSSNTSSSKPRINTRDMILCALFTALIAIGTFIRIPIPYIPITLQVMFVMLAAMLLGSKLGALSVLIYIAIGLAGIPVFTQGGGISYVLQPTFGYLVGFAVGAFLTGRITEKMQTPTVLRLWLAQLAGISVLYAIGMTYFFFMSNFYSNNPVTVGALFINSFLTTLPKDLLLSLLGAWLVTKLLPVLRRSR